MAYKLKLKQAPKFETPASGTSVNDVMEGKYNILKDTGFKLHSETKRFDIQIGKIKITDNFTVADILSAWSRYRIYCFLKYDENSPDRMPAIAIGRPYSSAKSQPPVSGRQRIRSFLYPLRHACGLVGFESAQDRPEIPCRAGQGVGLG